MNKKIINSIILIFLSVSLSYSSGVPKHVMSSDDTQQRKIELSEKLELLKKKKDKIAVYEEFAEIFFVANAYDEAADIYKTLLEMKPSKKKKAEYYIKLGDIEAAKKNYSGGFEHYQSAHALYQKDNKIKRKIGDMLFESNLYGLAEQSFKDILASDKNSNYAKRKLGDIYYKQNKFSKALEYYESVERKKYDSEIVINMARCYRYLNKIDKAEKIVGSFLDTFPHSEMYFFSGLLRADVGKTDEAERRFVSAIETDGTNFSAYVYLGALYMAKNNLDDAETVLTKAKKLNPNTAAVDILFAELSYKKENFSDSIKFISSALAKAKTPFVKRYCERMLEFFKEKR